ncbi:FecCD family ABC transporter permease [Kiloniella litopenaei]|nr:iron ABC transporter permease [Kiloniella litopenaei]
MSKISRLEDGTAGTDRGWKTTPPHNKLSGGRLSRFSFLLSEQKMTVMITLGLFFLVLSFSLAISIGAISVPAQTVWGIVLNKISPDTIEQTWSKGREAIVWDIRFPRAILAGFVGAGLAIVGATLQAVTRNPLADPHLLGISSGAAFGAIVALLHTGMFLGLATVPLFAFFGALAASGLVLLVSRLTASTSADRLILAGVAVSFVIMAGANILIFLGDQKSTHTVVFWMLGGLGLAQWSQLIYPLVILTLGGLYFYLKSSDLNAMTVGDETASTLGIPVARFRLIIFIVGALVTGVMVAFSGIIGFVGLMIPHILRRLVGGNYRYILPGSALVGAIFVIWSDVAARTIMAPEDMPIGIITGLVGGLFFIWLLGQGKRG